MDGNRIDDRLSSMRCLEHGLGEALSGPLPGREAHVRMAPRPRPGWRHEVKPDEARPAAAMLVLYPHGGLPHLLLTLRRRDLPAHSGQISLPGGAVERGEEIVAAALRETREEVGVPEREITPLGALSALHIPLSGFMLHPIVGIAERRLRWRPSPLEVESILEVPLARLGDREHVRVETWLLKDREARVPFFDLRPGALWGATAMVLAELMWILGAPPDPWDQVPEPVIR